MIGSGGGQRGVRSRSVQRNAARYEASSLPAFNFGEVLDLSATGMRVRRPGKAIVAVGGVEKFVIDAGAGAVVLRGRVVWVRKPSLFAKHHEFGVHFVNVDKSLSDRLVHIGQFGFDVGAPAESTAEAKANRKVLASIEVEDLYAILCVPENAHEDEIGRSYRTLVRRWHPDVCREADAGEQMARVSKAYKVLRDRELRRRYDEMRSTSARPATPPSAKAA